MPRAAPGRTPGPGPSQRTRSARGPRALRTFSAWIAGEGDLPADPFARLRGPRVDRRVRAVPTDEELERVLDGLDPERQVLLLALAGTGIRVGELCRLELDDLVGERLLVRDTKTREDRVGVISDV